MTNVGAWCVAALLLLAAPAWAGSTLRGVVVRDRERGAPMAGVELTASGANAVTTGNDGQFVLMFPQGHPGQDVSVRVSRVGWEVVNDVLLDRQLPEPGSAHRFEVIVCVSAEREQRRMEFYRLKADQAVEQTYRTKLAELEARHAATVQERDQLRHERDAARKQVAEWARQAAVRKPGEVSDTYKAAFRLFIDGKTDAALQLLRDERLHREVDQARAKMQEAQAQLHRAVAAWLLKGEILTTKFDYEGAGRAYDDAVAAASGSAQVWEAYASFHQDQNNLGNLNAAENRNAEARKDYEEALAIRRALALQDPDAYRPDVAATLNNLGVLNADENRKAEARKDYEEALNIRRALAARNPGVHRPYVARSLANLGNLNREEKRTAAARKDFEEALAIFRALAIENPDVHRPDIAKTLNNLGTLNRDEKRKAEARKAYEEALAIYREFAVQNPDVYQPDVAETLNNLGFLSADDRRTAEAHKDYEEALAIYRALATKNPDVYRPYVANTLNDFGLLSANESRTAEARKAYEEALAIYREFATRAPANYQPRVQQVEQALRDLGPVSP